jgi:hypothetical protein
MELPSKKTTAHGGGSSSGEDRLSAPPDDLSTPSYPPSRVEARQVVIETTFSNFCTKYIF